MKSSIIIKLISSCNVTSYIYFNSNDLGGRHDKIFNLFWMVQWWRANLPHWRSQGGILCSILMPIFAISQSSTPLWLNMGCIKVNLKKSKLIIREMRTVKNTNTWYLTFAGDLKLNHLWWSKTLLERVCVIKISNFICTAWNYFKFSYKSQLKVFGLNSKEIWTSI